MQRSSNEKPVIYIDVAGPILTDSVRDDAHLSSWTERVFITLHRISRAGSYHLVLFGEDRYRVPSITALLRRQGIVIDDGGTWEDIRQHHRTENVIASFIVAGDPQDAAQALNAEPVVFTNWPDLQERFLGYLEQPDRLAATTRKTGETAISLDLNLDGTGIATIDTGLPFFDHMLEQIARHGRFDMQLICKGDLAVDEHHTVEDSALVLGEAFRKALGDKRGINRYGFELLPMDECLAEVALDFSGRPWFVWDVAFTREYVGTFPTELLFHFFKSFSDEAKCNLHMKVNSGNAHHQSEALFKAFARALGKAVFRRAGNTDLPSTKGTL
jgi:imidazoleglycerol phosphate dehydratase HisB